MSDLIDLKDEKLAHALCSLLEPSPPVITAREARGPKFVWVSSHNYYSPQGWWQSQIGTDHGDESEDDSPIRWRPLLEITDLIQLAWRVVDEMKMRGWLFHVMAMTDGWVVDGRRYQLPGEGQWSDGKRVLITGDLVQEVGDEAPEAICRAAVAALETPPATIREVYDQLGPEVKS